jgi:phospholipase C
MFRGMASKAAGTRQWWSFSVVALVLAGVMLFPGCQGLGPTPVDNSGGVTTQSPVKNLVVVVMKLHSFDNLFGTFPGANGAKPGSLGFTQSDANGNSVSPSLTTNTNPPDLKHSPGVYTQEWNNGKMDGFAAANGDISMQYYDKTVANFGILWDYAQKFALADNYFNPSFGPAQSDVMYLISGQDNSTVATVFPNFGPCNSSSSTAPYTFPNVGDELSDKNIDWAWFHELYGQCGNYVSQENPFQYFTSTQNSEHIADGTLFFQRLQLGTLPSVSFVQPSPGHSMHPGSGDQTVGINWLDGLIKQAQASPQWKGMAIVVIWDEGIGWYDHVPPPVVGGQQEGGRVPMMVISPLAKTNYISHVRMDHVSVLRFIQWNWGLPSLTPRDQVGGGNIELKDMFTF